MQSNIGLGPAIHDPAGESVQVHEIGDEVYITLSDDFLQTTGWQVDDALIFDVVDGSVSITNPHAETRQKVRDAIKRQLEKS